MKYEYHSTSLWCDNDEEYNVLDKILINSDYNGHYEHTLSTGTKVYNYERRTTLKTKEIVYWITVFCRGKSNE